MTSILISEWDAHLWDYIWDSKTDNYIIETNRDM